MKVGNKLVAFITGGASGLGASTARRLHGQGAKVCIADMDELMMDKMKHELGDGLITAKCDVSKPEQVKQAVAHTIDNFGHLHVGLAAAGIV